MLATLRRLGLTGPNERPAATVLAGGVSSEVWRVDLKGGPVCAKRALPRLRVQAEWRAPVERSDFEAEWLRVAAGVPGVVAPQVIAHDPATHLLVMSWFEPADHPVWKDELAAGRVDAGFAAQVGRSVAKMHAATADDPAIAARFDTQPLFEALRVEPFLRAPAALHPDLASQLQAMAARTLSTRRALVHGDASPKNILVGPEGPVFLDAETAWYGDPAFDLAFLTTHLLLKTVWKPQGRDAYLGSLRALVAAYAEKTSWEPWEGLARRAFSLAPALILARVDGRSPAEYLDAGMRRRVRAAARALVAAPPADFEDLSGAWTRELETA